MERTPVNPTNWGLAFAMNQAEIYEGVNRTMRCSGQVAIREDPDSAMGISVVAPGDVRTQLAEALASVDQLLEGAGMTRSDIVQLHFFTTDMAGFMASYDVYAEWIGAAGVMPPQTLLGVAALAVEGLTVEVEITAAD